MQKWPDNDVAGLADADGFDVLPADAHDRLAAVDVVVVGRVNVVLVVVVLAVVARRVHPEWRLRSGKRVCPAIPAAAIAAAQVGRKIVLKIKSQYNYQWHYKV